MRRVILFSFIAVFWCVGISICSAQGFRLLMSKSIMEMPDYKKAAAIDQITDWTEVSDGVFIPISRR